MFLPIMIANFANEPVQVKISNKCDFQTTVSIAYNSTFSYKSSKSFDVQIFGYNNTNNTEWTDLGHVLYRTKCYLNGTRVFDDSNYETFVRFNLFSATYILVVCECGQVCPLAEEQICLNTTAGGSMSLLQ